MNNTNSEEKASGGVGSGGGDGVVLVLEGPRQ